MRDSPPSPGHGSSPGSSPRCSGGRRCPSRAKPAASPPSACRTRSIRPARTDWCRSAACGRPIRPAPGAPAPKRGCRRARRWGPANIRPREDFLVTGLPALERMGAAASGLLAAAQIALSLALAAAGLQAFGTALGHEAVFRLRGGTDLTSRRLATTRLALTLIATAGYLASAHNLFDAKALLVLALGTVRRGGGARHGARALASRRGPRRHGRAARRAIRHDPDNARRRSARLIVVAETFSSARRSASSPGSCPLDPTPRMCRRSREASSRACCTATAT